MSGEHSSRLVYVFAHWLNDVPLQSDSVENAVSLSMHGLSVSSPMSSRCPWDSGAKQISWQIAKERKSRKTPERPLRKDFQFHKH